MIRHKSAAVIDLAVEDMADTWRKAIPGYLGRDRVNNPICEV